MYSKITIVVPVYNIPEQLLRNCLKSLSEQTLKDVEMILVDDGSKNNSGKVCDEFAASDKRIKVVHSENKGVSNARNLGIELSTSPYIIFVDADDYIAKDACEKLYEVAIKEKCDILFFKPTGTKYVDTLECKIENKNALKELQIDIIRHKEDHQGFVLGSPWGKVFDRKFLLDNSLTFTLGVKRSQDRLFMLYALEKAKKVSFFSYSGYTYVKNDESICNKYNQNMVSILDNAYKHIEEFVEKYHHNEEEFIEAMYQLKLKFIYTDIQLYYLNRKRNINCIYAAKELRAIFEDQNVNDAVRHMDNSLIKKKMKVFYTLIAYKQYYLAAVTYRIMDFMTRMRDTVK